MSLEAIGAIGASVVALLALCVSIATTRAAMRQNRIENFIAIQSFLHDGELSAARQSVREGRVVVSMQESQVRQVCSSFDFAGVLVRNDAVDKELFLDYWGVGLLALEKKLLEVGEEQTGSVRVRDYYKNFYWLMTEARRYE